MIKFLFKPSKDNYGDRPIDYVMFLLLAPVLYGAMWIALYVVQ